MRSARLDRLSDALAVMLLRDPVLSVTLPVHLTNTSNARQHWGTTARKARVRHTVTLAVQTRARHVGSVLSGVGVGDLAVLAVRLVYIGPRELDDDGVASAVKSLRDGVADALGVNDRDPRVTWVPDQERGGVREYAARVEVYRVAAAPRGSETFGLAQKSTKPT